MEKRINDLSTKIEVLTSILPIARNYMACRGPRSDEDFEMFKSWVEAQIALAAENLDECPKCKSNPNKQMGGIPCERCGAIGLQPWGG
jgi:hypothetical protein